MDAVCVRQGNPLKFTEMFGFEPFSASARQKAAPASSILKISRTDKQPLIRIFHDNIMIGVFTGGTPESSINRPLSVFAGMYGIKLR